MRSGWEKNYSINILFKVSTFFSLNARIKMTGIKSELL